MAEADATAILVEMERLRALYAKQRYREVADGAQKLIEIAPVYVPALLLFARAGQLMSNEELDSSTEKRIDEYLMRAVKADPSSVEALNDLAYFKRTYLADEGAGLSLFEKSISLSLGQLREAIAGRIRSLEDKGDSTAAAEARAEAIRILGADPIVDN